MPEGIVAADNSLARSAHERPPPVRDRSRFTIRFIDPGTVSSLRRPTPASFRLNGNQRSNVLLIDTLLESHISRSAVTMSFCNRSHAYQTPNGRPDSTRPNRDTRNNTRLYSHSAFVVWLRYTNEQPNYSGSSVKLSLRTTRPGLATSVKQSTECDSVKTDMIKSDPRSQTMCPKERTTIRNQQLSRARQVLAYRAPSERCSADGIRFSPKSNLQEYPDANYEIGRCSEAV
jgi:hypothetical protein